MLVYAPRDEAEVEIVAKVIAAAVWWVSGVDVNGDLEGPKRKSKDVADIVREMEGKECWACRVNGCGGNQVEKMTSDA